MTWRLGINHVTRFHYDRPVVASYNEARVTPLTTAGQIALEATVGVEPRTETFVYRDYWGTVVHSFNVHEPHDCLVVTARSLVETATRGPASGEGPLSALTWERLASPEVKDRFYELLTPTCLTGTDELAGTAEALRAAHKEPRGALESAVSWAHDQLEYGSGTTHVNTSAAEAWRAGRGVCQDFAHLCLALLRASGIPARYVSGYFYPNENGEVGAAVQGESHAWVEAWTGEWSAHDPTNLVRVGERHVVVARGRDYSDVSPLRGIFSGPPGSSTEVAVDLTRVA